MKIVFGREQKPLLFAKIISKEGNTLCTVKDRKGRQFSVESDGSYQVGKQVMIRNGVIVALAKRPETVPSFNV